MHSVLWVGFVAIRIVSCNETRVKITRKDGTVFFFPGLALSCKELVLTENGRFREIWETLSRKWSRSMEWAFFVIASSFTWDSFLNLCSVCSITK